MPEHLFRKLNYSNIKFKKYREAYYQYNTVSLFRSLKDYLFKISPEFDCYGMIFKDIKITLQLLIFCFFSPR